MPKVPKDHIKALIQSYIQFHKKMKQLKGQRMILEKQLSQFLTEEQLKELREQILKNQ